ncbi:unannotated protein [freshwater metagenome]|jgi:threonine dehydrogenase-like Zn-dependent dehydrogenase|uniref:Unannotated protein n=1 Tax=freshwater metagenome TaxID=449393 RepID=A0A6J7IZ27_9ZZZZ|nr:alcohol dehydrogenase catalytic domain-containing protein [Actinomycetota bacterium]
MRATVIHGTHDIRVDDVPDPSIIKPTDAIVKITASCVCGSDLWSYRGITPVEEPKRIGHELVGVIEEVGSEVKTLKPGDFVIAPFATSDGTCVNCQHGMHTSCVNGSFFSAADKDGLIDGGQGEWARAPWADGTLVKVPEMPDADMIPSLLTLSDVMGTGHHAAIAAGVKPGDRVVVVGDGAVGLSAVLAASRLGAERIILMSRHADRQAIGKRFGATDIVEERGPDGIARIQELLGGPGADAALECVGTQESLEQAVGATRPGGRVGYVGLPHAVSQVPIFQMFLTNVSLSGGIAPVRSYLDELLKDVLDGTIEPGLVFDLQLPLGEVADAYAAMDERRSIKTLLWPGR